jgi:hypothetical protein
MPSFCASVRLSMAISATDAGGKNSRALVPTLAEHHAAKREIIVGGRNEPAFPFGLLWIRRDLGKQACELMGRTLEPSGDIQHIRLRTDCGLAGGAAKGHCP